MGGSMIKFPLSLQESHRSILNNLSACRLGLRYTKVKGIPIVQVQGNSLQSVDSLQRMLGETRLEDRREKIEETRSNDRTNLLIEFKGTIYHNTLIS